MRTLLSTDSKVGPPSETSLEPERLEGGGQSDAIAHGAHAGKASSGADSLGGCINPAPTVILPPRGVSPVLRGRRTEHTCGGRLEDAECRKDRFRLDGSPIGALMDQATTRKCHCSSLGYAWRSKAEIWMIVSFVLMNIMKRQTSRARESAKVSTVLRPECAVQREKQLQKLQGEITISAS